MNARAVLNYIYFKSCGTDEWVQFVQYNKCLIITCAESTNVGLQNPLYVFQLNAVTRPKNQKLELPPKLQQFTFNYI